MSTRKECILCNNINFSKSLFNFEKFHLFLRNTRQVCDSSKKVLVIKRHTQSVTLHNPIPWHASIYSFFSLNIFQTTRYQQKYYTFEDPISLWKSENVDVANPVDKVEYQKNQWKHLPAKDVFCHQKIDQEPHWLVNTMKNRPPAIRVNFMDELDSVLVESALLNPSDCHCYIWEWRTENFSGSNLGWLLIETELCQMMPVRWSKLCIIIKYISLYITIIIYIIIYYYYYNNKYDYVLLW